MLRLMKCLVYQLVTFILIAIFTYLNHKAAINAATTYDPGMRLYVHIAQIVMIILYLTASIIINQIDPARRGIDNVIETIFIGIVDIALLVIYLIPSLIKTTKIFPYLYEYYYYIPYTFLLVGIAICIGRYWGKKARKVNQ